MQDDIEYLSVGLEIAARLRDMSFNVEADLEYLAAGGSILYCIDPQILDVLIDPINNLVDVNLFGRTRDDVRRLKTFLGDHQRGIQLSIARLFFLSLIGEDAGVHFAEEILLHPAYDNEVRAAITHYKRAAQSTVKSSLIRYRSQAPTEDMQDSIRAIEEAVEKNNRGDSSKLDTYATILENMSGALTYALVPEKETPLARLRAMAERGLFSRNRDALEEITSPQDIRRLTLYDRCADQLFAEKRHVLNAKDPRSERDLNLAVSTDAQAIVSVILLNERFKEKGLKRRVIFLTADATILKLFSSSHSRQQILPAGQADNFIRSPLEIPSLFSPSERGARRGGLLKRIKYFDYFLDGGAEFREQSAYRSYLNSIRFQERRVNLPDVQSASSLPSLIIRGVEHDLRDVLRTFEVEIARRAFQNIDQFIKSVKIRLSGFASDITEILDQSWAASDAISDGISQLLGISLLYSSGNRRRDLIWVLNAIMEPQGPNSQLAKLPGFRFPCFLKFSDRQLNYFQSLLSEKAKADEIFNNLTDLHRGELTLANAFLFGVAGDWRKAERLSLAASQYDSRKDRERRESDYKLLEEATYFRAVAVRHSMMPSVSRWMEAAELLALIVAKDSQQADLRYIVEYAVLGLSVPYHAYFYRKPEYDRVNHLSPRDTRVLFEHAAGRFEQEYGLRDSELSVRLGTQIYSNLCLLYMHEKMIQPRLVSDLRESDGERYAELLRHHLSQSEEHPVSYFVALIQKAMSLEFSHMEPQDRAKSFDEFVSDLAEKNGTLILQYDWRKIDDLTEYFRSRNN